MERIKQVLSILGVVGLGIVDQWKMALLTIVLLVISGLTVQVVVITAKLDDISNFWIYILEVLLILIIAVQWIIAASVGEEVHKSIKRSLSARRRANRLENDINQHAEEMTLDEAILLNRQVNQALGETNLDDIRRVGQMQENEMIFGRPITREEAAQRFNIRFVEGSMGGESEPDPLTEDSYGDWEEQQN